MTAVYFILQVSVNHTGMCKFSLYSKHYAKNSVNENCTRKYESITPVKLANKHNLIYYISSHENEQDCFEVTVLICTDIVSHLKLLRNRVLK